MGSTGAGKTTITNLINRFYEIESGQITYDGIDAVSYTHLDVYKSQTYEWGYSAGAPMAIAPLPNVRQVLDLSLIHI